MTRSREMWAPKPWLTADGFAVFPEAEDWCDDPIPVRVTDISDEPEFSKGDRVIIDHDVNMEATVADKPVVIEGGWKLPVRPKDKPWELWMWACHRVTKLPREKSVTIRGDAGRVDALSEAMNNGGAVVMLSTDGLRVERVEDES